MTYIAFALTTSSNSGIRVANDGNATITASEISFITIAALNGLNSLSDGDIVLV